MSPLAILISFAATSAADVADAPSYHEELTALSVGSFTTIDQSARDDRYSVAEAEVVRIWPAREDGVWFYQEQALLGDRPDTLNAAKKDEPYFARVIHSVETAPGIVRRTVHRLKSPEKAKGAWRRKTPLVGMGPDDLLPSECVITATRVAEKMWRSESEQCPNAYKGAAYALSLGVTVENRYANWDRGFTTNGEQVWGPTAGGYIFIRKSEGTK